LARPRAMSLIFAVEVFASFRYSFAFTDDILESCIGRYNRQNVIVAISSSAAVVEVPWSRLNPCPWHDRRGHPPSAPKPPSRPRLPCFFFGFFKVFEKFQKLSRL
jgi:hypothetical protein